MGTWVGTATNSLMFHPSTKWFWMIIGYPIGFFLFFKSKIVLWTSISNISGEGASYLGPAIYVNWHRHLPYLIAHHGVNHRWMMVSKTQYMTPIAIWCSLMGLKLARGASGLRGREALRELGVAIKAGESVSIAVDGPAGPGFSVKRGCIDLAKDAGVPIIPVSYSCKRGRSNRRRWDKMLVPSTCDQIDVKYGRPLYVDPNSSELEIRNEIGKALNRLDPELSFE